MNLKQSHLQKSYSNNHSLPVNNNSYAHKYGISKENRQIGLNPNLNIEDQYVQNLLKQIHFMNMEVKLLKQKQQMSQGNSLWGIVNRTNEPLVTNILHSNQKYQNMKKQLDTTLNKTQYQNTRLANQQNATIVKMNFLQKQRSNLDQKIEQTRQCLQQKKNKIRAKVYELQQKKKNILSQKQKQNKRNLDLASQYSNLIEQSQTQKFNNFQETSRIKNEEDIQTIILQQKIKDIQSIKQQINNIKKTIQSSSQYQRAKQDESNIKNNMILANKNIAQAQFQLLQINQSIKLAQGERDHCVIQRKKLTQQLQTLKTVLKQIQQLNQVRILKQIQSRKVQSIQIQKGQLQTKKLQKHLEQIKKKVTKSQQVQKQLRKQVQNMERQLLKIKEKRQNFGKIVSQISISNDKTQTQLATSKNQMKKIQDQLDKLRLNQTNSLCQLNDISTQVVFLRERKQYLLQMLNLKQTLNQTRLQQLQKVVQRNKDVNDTVGTLMEKWQQIKSFSKM